MPILGASHAMGEMWNILRQVNLAEIRDRSQNRFTVLITGDPLLATDLAQALSWSQTRTGVHPWLQVIAPPVDVTELWPRPAGALLVMTRPEAGPDERETIRALNNLELPVVTVVIGPAALDPGASQTGFGEAARAVVPDLADTGALGAALLPAMANAVASTFPDAEVSLARQFPVLRDAAVTRMVEETARTNAMFSATTGVGEMIPILTVPLVVGDTVVLTKNQMVMAYKIALAAGKDGQPQDVMGEIMGVIGGALLFRTVARQLVGLVPVIGIVPKVAVAYSGTKVIGKAVEIWAVEERHPSPEEIRRLTVENWSRGRALAANLVRQVRPGQRALPPPEGASGEPS